MIFYQALTLYEPVPTEKVSVMWKARPDSEVPLYPVGFLDVGELGFEVYEGRGGHLSGEIILVDYSHKLAFTGDVYVNMHGMSPEQARYNRYAPILMTSVDTDPMMCRSEREALFQRMGAGEWTIFSGHGAAKRYDVRTAEERGRADPRKGLVRL